MNNNILNLENQIREISKRTAEQITDYQFGKSNIFPYILLDKAEKEINDIRKLIKESELIRA